MKTNEDLLKTLKALPLCKNGGTFIPDTLVDDLVAALEKAKVTPADEVDKGVRIDEQGNDDGMRGACFSPLNNACFASRI